MTAAIPVTADTCGDKVVCLEPHEIAFFLQLVVWEHEGFKPLERKGGRGAGVSVGVEWYDGKKAVEHDELILEEEDVDVMMDPSKMVPASPSVRGFGEDEDATRNLTSPVVGDVDLGNWDVDATIDMSKGGAFQDDVDATIDVSNMRPTSPVAVRMSVGEEDMRKTDQRDDLVILETEEMAACLLCLKFGVSDGQASLKRERDATACPEPKDTFDNGGIPEGKRRMVKVEDEEVMEAEQQQEQPAVREGQDVIKNEDDVSRLPDNPLQAHPATREVTPFALFDGPQEAWSYDDILALAQQMQVVPTDMDVITVCEPECPCKTLPRPDAALPTNRYPSFINMQESAATTIPFVDQNMAMQPMCPLPTYPAYDAMTSFSVDQTMDVQMMDETNLWNPMRWETSANSQAEAIPSEPSFVDLLQMDAATLFEELGSVPPAPFATGTSDKSEQDTSSSPLPSSSTKNPSPKVESIDPQQRARAPYSFFLAWTKEEKKKNKRKFDKSAYDMWKEMTEAEKERFYKMSRDDKRMLRAARKEQKEREEKKTTEAAKTSSDLEQNTNFSTVALAIATSSTTSSPLQH